MAKKKPPKESLERRVVTGSVDMRAEDGEPRRISGVASVFNTETVIGDGMWAFREKIAPGAFDGALKRPDDVRALFNHNPDHVLGRTPKTLRLSVKDDGLHYEFDVPNTSTGRDMVELIERGDVTGSSFGFKVKKDTWDESGKIPLRTITDVELWDVSPVTYPAYQSTSVSAEARSHAEAAHKRSELDELREILAEANAWEV